MAETEKVLDFQHFHPRKTKMNKTAPHEHIPPSRKKWFTLFVAVFSIHLVLVGLICWSIIQTKTYYAPPDESDFTWIILLILDFPLSLIVLFTSGPAVVSMPEFLNPVSRFFNFSGIFPSSAFRDIIWPAIVFQIVGTANWMLIFFVISKKGKIDRFLQKVT